MLLHRHWLSGRAGKVTNAAGVAHQIPSIIIQDHLNHDIAGEQLTILLPGSTAPRIDDLFRWNDNFAEELFKTFQFYFLQQRLANCSLPVCLHF